VKPSEEIVQDKDRGTRQTVEDPALNFPDSEMGTLINQKDWSSTPIGAPETWSPALRTTVRILVANRFPMLLWWGPQ
jgi:hypothetical protein